MSTRVRRLAVFASLTAALVVGLATGPGYAQEATPTAAPVVREVLGSGEPASAGRTTLELVRFTIAPGTRLPAHTHPGMQVASVVSGELTYTVVSGGEVPITRASTEVGVRGEEETLGAGETTTMRPGDSFVEPEGVVHFGENLGVEPVILLVSSLFTTGEPPSSIVATPAA